MIYGDKLRADQGMKSAKSSVNQSEGKIEKRLKDSRIIGLGVFVPSENQLTRSPLWADVQGVNTCWGPNPLGDLSEALDEECQCNFPGKAEA